MEKSASEKLSPSMTLLEKLAAGEILDPDGRRALWVASLEEVFEERVHGFGTELVDELVALGECDQAVRLAGANLAMAPAHLEDCLAYTDCSGRLGHWDQGRAAVERAIAATARGDPGIPYLRFERARILTHTGDPARAREELNRVLDTPGASAKLAALARRSLAALDAPAKPE